MKLEGNLKEQNILEVSRIKQHKDNKEILKNISFMTDLLNPKTFFRHVDNN